MRIALVDEGACVASRICAWLESAGHSCQGFCNARSFMREVKRQSFDFVILGWMLPDMTGSSLLAWLRGNMDWDIPLVIVAERSTEDDVVHALDLGADDFIVAPLREREVLARIEAVRRRSTRLCDVPARMHVPPYTIDVEGRSVSISGTPLSMTSKEYELTLALFRNRGRLLSREHLLESVWGVTDNVSTRTVDTHVSRLRKKLRFSEHDGWRLSAVQNHGYILSLGHDRSHTVNLYSPEQRSKARRAADRGE